MRALAAALLLLACNETASSQGPRKQCAAHRARLQPKAEQLAALTSQVKASPALEAEELPKRPVSLGDPESVRACLERLGACRADDTGLEEAVARCQRIDTVAIIRPIEEVPATPTGVEGKFKGGFIRGEAFIFSLADPPVKLGALKFETRLTEPVEIYRDFTSAQIEHALSEGLRKSAFRAIERAVER